jgi:hypothetical protein
MPGPTSSQVHINRLLTNMSVAYVQSSDKFAALRVFPGLNVTKKSDNYAVYSKDDFLRDEMEVRAPSSESAGGSYAVDLTPSYLAQRYAVHIDVDWDTIANADEPLQPTNDASAWLGQKVLIKHESIFVANFFTTGVWTGGTKASAAAGDLVAGTDFTAWDDVTSTPIEDIDGQKESIEAQTGFVPTGLCLNRRGWNALRNHPDIIDRVKHTSNMAVARSIVANLMELDEIVVGAAVKNSGAKGLAGSTNYMMGNHALLYHRGQPSLRAPLAGVTFRWTGLPGSVDGMQVSTIQIPERKTDRHEVEMNIDMKVVAPTLGAFFQNIVS